MILSSREHSKNKVFIETRFSNKFCNFKSRYKRESLQVTKTTSHKSNYLNPKTFEKNENQIFTRFYVHRVRCE